LQLQASTLLCSCRFSVSLPSARSNKQQYQFTAAGSSHSPQINSNSLSFSTLKFQHRIQLLVHQHHVSHAPSFSHALLQDATAILPNLKLVNGKTVLNF
jgi:hypothetical protein